MFTRYEEYERTIDYMMRPGTVSSHRVIGVGPEQNVQLVADDLVAWHAAEDNQSYLGIELCQPFPDDEYSDYQYETAAATVREWARQFGFALDRQHILGHEETAQGKRAGKSDPGLHWSWTRFMALLR